MNSTDLMPNSLASSNDTWNYNNGKIKILALYLVSFSILCIAYKYYIVIYWKYYGFSLNINMIKMGEAILLLSAIVLMLPSKPSKPSDFLLHIHMLLPVLPMLVLYGVSNQDRTYIYFVSLAFISIIALRHIPFSLPLRGSIATGVLLRACLTISFLNIFAIVAFGGLKYVNFNLLDVYEYRRNAAENLPSIFAYMSPTVSKVLLPFSLVMAVRSKSVGYQLLSIVGSVLMFALTSHKGPLFYPFLALFLYYFAANRRKIIRLLMGFVTMTGVTTIIAFVYGNTLIPSLILRRGLFLPAAANYGYHHYFSFHPHIYLASSKLTFGLIDYPYELTPPKLVGKAYWGSEDLSANTGWLGTGFMHFDYFGLILFAAIVGLILRTIDSLSDYQDKSLVTGLMVVPCFALFVSTDLPTAILTHGLAVAIILIWLMPRSRKVQIQ